MMNKHFSDKEIEIYILSRGKETEFGEELLKHIESCRSCKDLFTEISEYYLSLEENEGKLPYNVQLRITDNIPIKIKPSYIKYKPPAEEVAVVYSNIPYIAKRYVINHPIKSSSYLVAAALVFLFFFNYKTLFRDSAPAYYLLDDYRDILQVYNAGNELLWQKKYFGDKEIRAEETSTEMKRVILSDIDNDGRNEIITILRGLEKEETSTILRILDGKGNVKLEKKLGREISYNGNLYDAIFMPRSLVVDDFSGSGKKEILVGLYTRYSPSVLFRLDANGNLLGEYWHYGKICSMNQTIIRDRKAIVIAGIDEVSKKADAAVLDPEKLTDIQISREHIGFGNYKSDAEIFKVVFPLSDMDNVITNSKPRARLIIPMNDKTIGFTAGHDLDGLPVFEYYFDRNTLNLSEIKINDKARYAHNKLTNEGKIKSTLNEKYIQSLKNNLRLQF